MGGRTVRRGRVMLGLRGRAAAVLPSRTCNYLCYERKTPSAHSHFSPPSLFSVMPNNYYIVQP